MEIIVVIFGIILFWGLVSIVLSAGKATTKATYNAATGKTSFSEGFRDSWGGMGEFEIRVREDSVVREELEFEVFIIEAKGIIPYRSGEDISFSTSIIDTTDEDNPKPVICMLDVFQEPNSRIYLNQRRYGVINQELGYREWTEIGLAPKSTLVPAGTGWRDFTFFNQIATTISSQSINMSVIPYEGLIHSSEFNIEYFNPNKGYEEIREDAEFSQEASVKLAIHLATLDGDLDKREGGFIKEWMGKALGELDANTREDRKEKLNNALREAHSKFKSGMTSHYVNKQINILIDKGEKLDHFECIELLLDVMSSDGVAHDSELKFINKTAKKFDINQEDLNLMREKRMLSIDNLESADGNIEEILGIDKSSTNQEILDQLTKMFSMWNSRMESLSDEKEKESAKNMLDLISKARKKYS